MEPREIRTERLTLVPVRVEHAEEMAGVLGDPELYGFIGGAPATVHELTAQYGRWVVGSPDPAVSWCNWMVRLRSEDCLVGTVQATVGPDESEVAWMVGTPWQGRGIAAEAARGLVEWLVREGARTVVAHVHPDHRASAAVASAAGLAPTEEWQDGEVRWRLRAADVRPAGTVGYREAAGRLAEQYESVTFEQVHGQVLELIPVAPCRVLDVGAGTGRDAAALAARGHSVVAVEPTVELRVHTGGEFEWVADLLPELRSVQGEFDLVLLTAVWMHLDATEREQAMRRIAGLLAPGGRVLMLLRRGPVPPGRLMFEVSADETALLAAEFGLIETHRSNRSDGHGRTGVDWTHLALDLADL